MNSISDALARKSLVDLVCNRGLLIKKIGGGGELMRGGRTTEGWLTGSCVQSPA